MKTRIYNEGQLIKERLAEISDYIYNNPELGNEEYKAVEALTTFLKEHNFKIEVSNSRYKQHLKQLLIVENQE